VHVRVLVEGEEERAGEAVVSWVRADDRGADAAIVFDSGMPDPDTPAVTVGLRGMVDVDVTVRTAERNLHSGLYGGAVLNALHVLHGQLGHVIPGPDGRVREELRAGTSAPAAAEVESWKALVPGDRAIAEGGGKPVAPGAGIEFYERTGAQASVEVNQIAGGEPRTVVPPAATAKVTMRLAPGQDPEEMSGVLLGLLRRDLPEGAELHTRVQTAMPALFEVDQPAIELAARALERACGTAPAFLRSGGSIPIVAEMAAQGYPVIVGGFGLPDDAIHAPDESYALRSLEWGQAAARELYVELAQLPR
jgi:acetylornithine deacetylase/succinyl-diaminopimelate desuccinylase-like protein